MSDKIDQIRLFSERGIPAPYTVALFQNGTLVGVGGKKVSMGQLIHRYLTREGDKLFIKPSDGVGGNGILVVKRRGGQLLLNKQPVEEHEVLPALLRGKNYLVQVGLKQREDISTINPSSINTLRSITQIRNNKAVLCVCVMRIGRNNMDLDNSAQGGISIPVDLETGILRDYATAEHGGGRIYFHPDTGCEFKSRKIIGWEEIKAQIIEFADRLPEFRDLAWDVAITEEGIKIIEINFNYGLDHLQLGCGKGMRKILNVYPDVLRH